MTRNILFIFAFILTGFCSLYGQAANWEFDTYFPPAPNLLYGNTGGHGVAVDPDGKIWILPYAPLYPDSVWVPGTGYVGVKPVYVFNPDGSQVSFSPIKKVVVNGTTYALSSYKTVIVPDNNGNMLIYDSGKLYRINYKTGAAMDMGNVTSSLALPNIGRPAVDKNGYVYVACVFPGYPLKKLNPDLTFNSNLVDNISDYGRTLEVSPDGKVIYAIRYSGATVYKYQKNDATGAYSLSANILNGFKSESSFYDAISGVLWLSAGSYSDKPTNPKYTPETWYAMNTATEQIIDSLKWKMNGPESGEERPRGIAFNSDRRMAYICCFGNSNYPIVQRLRSTKPFTPQYKWKADIIISDASVSTQKAVTFGMSDSATDGIDKVLSEMSLPPLPPSGVFDVRFILPVTPAEASLRDIRSSMQGSAGWTLQFQPGPSGYPITFSWNPDFLPEGVVILKDAVTGTIVNVDMKKQSSYRLTNSGITKLKIEFRGAFTYSLSINEDWNLISIPVLADKMEAGVILQGASAGPFSYSSNGYDLASLLENKKAYWVRFSNPREIPVSGQLLSGSVSVSEGWNLLGTLDYNIPVKFVTTAPEGIINSSWFGYNQQYMPADTLRPGKGYWVKVSQAGTINFSSDGIKKSSGTIASGAIAKASALNGLSGKIIISDNDGKSTALYNIEANAVLGNYELPPIPPAGVFDVRFSDGTFADKLSLHENEIVINSAKYPVQIKAEGMKIKIKDALTGEMVNSVLENGQELTIENSKLNRLIVTQGDIMPDKYQLNQNYPNPFNPSTIISYSIPKDEFVTIKVYNILGEEITALVNQKMPAGNHFISFNALNISAGAYFYKITAGNYSETKKMLYLK